MIQAFSLILIFFSKASPCGDMISDLYFTVREDFKGRWSSHFQNEQLQ
jgi:hypothetical protein